MQYFIRSYDPFVHEMANKYHGQVYGEFRNIKIKILAQYPCAQRYRTLYFGQKGKKGRGGNYYISNIFCQTQTDSTMCYLMQL